MSVGGGGTSQDCDLNLAPIIDCFTVLIAFLLVSTAYVSIGILDAGVAAAGHVASPTTPPTVTLTVELAKDGSFSLKLGGKASGTHSAANEAALEAQLKSLKSRWSDLGAVTLSADPAVEYRDVVKAMESVRKVIPVVALGGF